MSAPVALTNQYAGFLLEPHPGPDVCSTCFNLIDGYRRCYACTHIEPWLDRLLPISYSVGGEALHQALYGYKRLHGRHAQRLQAEVASVLWRFLLDHESCLGEQLGVGRFDLITVVPSTDRRRDEHHPLRTIVSTMVPLTRSRHHRLLRRTGVPVERHAFHRNKYEAVTSLGGDSILLLDDTWTTGANAQSAAAALKQAGAGAVGCIVIGRYVNRDWHANEQRLGLLPGFDWQTCALCRQHPQLQRHPRPRLRLAAP